MDFRQRGNRNVMFPNHFGPCCKAPNYQGRGRFHKAGNSCILESRVGKEVENVGWKRARHATDHEGYENGEILTHMSSAVFSASK